MTRVGLRTSPWSGAEIASTVGNEVQKRWHSPVLRTRLDAEMADQPTLANRFPDRSHANAEANAAATQPERAAGVGQYGAGADYTAAAVGVGYLNESWSGNGRVEWRHSDLDDKLNILLGAQRLLDAGRTVAAGFIYSESDSALVHTSKFDGRIAYALRPSGSRWILLDRFDVIDETIEVSETAACACASWSTI